MNEEKPDGAVLGDALIKKLRENFTARNCVEEVMTTMVGMAKAVGVEVSWEVVSVDDAKITDKKALLQLTGRLTTAMGALLSGGHVDPMALINAQDPMRLLRERKHNLGT